MSKSRRKERADFRRLLSFLLALVGGWLLVIAGVAGSLGILGYAFEQVSLLLPEAAAAIRLSLALLAVVASLGGVAVITGGLLILKRRRLTGKLFISLGGGVGVIGFAINLISRVGLSWAILSGLVAFFVAGRSVSWIGVILSVIAGIVA